MYTRKQAVSNRLEPPRFAGSCCPGSCAVNTLSAAEKQAVFYVLCSIEMICVAYFESRAEFKELAKTNRRMLQYIIENQDAIRAAV